MRNAKVQEELKLDDGQKGKIQEVNQALTKRRRELSADLRAAKPEERKKKQAEYRTKLQEATADANKKAVAELKDEQRTRLDQIQLQLRGISALGDKSVVGKLKITDGQQQKIAAAHEAYAKDNRELFDDLRTKKINFAKFREKRTELSKARDEKITGTLTKEQAAQFDKMQGEKFELPPRPRLGVAAPIKLKVVPGKIRKVKPKAEPQQDDE